MTQRSTRRAAAVPVLAWLVAAAVVFTTAALLGYAPWHSSTWARWDSGLYEDIARNGYDLFPCREEPEKWCGDAGWFPAYPWAVGALHLVGLPLQGSAVVLSWLFAVATIVLIWATFLGRRTDAAVVAAIVYAAFAPGQIYHYAIFPLSLCALATVASLWLLYRARFAGAGIAGGLAALAYPAGLVIAPVSAIWLLLQRDVPIAERLRRIAITSGLVVVAVWVLFVDQRLETGHWNAYLLVQDKYEHEWQSPIRATLDMLGGGSRSAVDVAVALQTALVTAVLALVVGRSVLSRASVASADVLVLLWALATWALPLSQSGVSIQRGQATLLPVAILVARLPRRIAWSLALAAVALAVWMEHYFLDSTLF